MKLGRNPSLTLTTAQVDELVDAIYRKEKVDPKTIIASNLLNGKNLHGYIEARWDYSQQNHITRRKNSLYEKLRKALGNTKAQLSVFKINIELSHYTEYVLGHVVAASITDAIRIAHLVYGHVLCELQPKRIEAILVGAGTWKECMSLNNEAIEHDKKIRADKLESIARQNRAINTIDIVIRALETDLTQQKDE